MMVNALLAILALYILLVVTWALYICSMQLRHHRHELHPVAKAHAYALAGLMLALDLVMNIVMSVPLLEPPRWDRGEWLLSPRLKRLNGHGSWRGRIAAWLCEHMLNQFDRSGDHC